MDDAYGGKSGQSVDNVHTLETTSPLTFLLPVSLPFPWLPCFSFCYVASLRIVLHPRPSHLAARPLVAFACDGTPDSCILDTSAAMLYYKQYASINRHNRCQPQG